VLDPFAGGGSIPLEALRLGCETYAGDYSPVAVFIEKATLEWPQKFGIEVELPREMVEGATDDVRQLELDGGGDTVKVNLLAFLVGWLRPKSGANVEVLGPHKRGEVKKVDNMVDVLHRACQLWEKGHKEELTQLLAQPAMSGAEGTGYGQGGAVWQFCQAVAECLLNGSKEKQLLEGMLMGKDAYARESAEVIAKAKKPEPQQLRLIE